MRFLNEFSDQFADALVARIRMQRVILDGGSCNHRQRSEAQQGAGDPAAASVVVIDQSYLHISTVIVLQQPCGLG